MRQAPTFASLDEAIVWVRDRWDGQRTVPLRLHESRTTEGELGAPRFSHGFINALDGSPAAVSTEGRTQSCGHPLLAGRPSRDCPECYGAGVKEVRLNLYRYPMTLALSRLARSLPVNRRQPHPYLTIATLAEHDWDARSTVRSLAMSWDAGEAHLLRCLRQLHSRYQEGPVPRVGWVDKSDAQRSAESWSAA
jgi:hypothetical protein